MTDATETCYICYEQESATNPFLIEPICACKGSLKVHQFCFELAQTSERVCSICKTGMGEKMAFDEQFWYVHDRHYIMQSVYRSVPFRVSRRSVHGEGTTYELTYGPNGRRYCSKMNGYAKYKQHGPYVEYNQAGEEICECVYEHGELNGPYRKLYEEEKLLIEANYNDGAYDGQVKWWSLEIGDEKELIAEATYSNGKCVNGTTFEIDRGYRTTFELKTYKDTVLHGTYKKGVEKIVLEEGTYDNGLRQGQWTTHAIQFGENEPTLSSIVHYKGGKLHGLCCVYNDKGDVYAKGAYLNGKPVGNHIYKSYHDKEITFERLRYNRKGRLQGPAYFFDHNGKLEQFHTYRNGALHGLQVLYEHGKTVAEFYMRNGLFDGRFILFDDNNKYDTPTVKVKGKNKKGVVTNKDFEALMRLWEVRQPAYDKGSEYYDVNYGHHCRTTHTFMWYGCTKKEDGQVSDSESDCWDDYDERDDYDEYLEGERDYWRSRRY
jgi:antitoxin component YwqK of YwqJK toxin-antitoxin module